MTAPGPIYVEGDYEVPPGSRIPGGVVSTGILKLGDRCICDGDVVGARAVVLGEHVTIHGNIFSGGPVLLGADPHVEGRINPPGMGPFEGVDGPAAKQGQAHVEKETAPDPMLHTAIQETLAAMLEVAWDAHQRGELLYPASWGPLKWEAATDVLAGAIAMVNKAHRGGKATVPWPSDDIFDVLLGRVATAVVPMSIKRTGPDSAIAEVGRPQRVFGSPDKDKGWPTPALSFITLLGNAVHPGFRLKLVGEQNLLSSEANPDQVTVLMSLVPVPDPRREEKAA